MGVKKTKSNKRTVDFFTIICNFKQPYKVLLDGNFVHAARETHLDSISEGLAKLLGGPIKSYVTPCTLRELKGLGPDFKETHKLARKSAMILQCGHDTAPMTARECIEACTGSSNTEHYFTATQDRGLRSHLGQNFGGASLFISVNGLHLELPSERQRREASEATAAAMLPGQHELRAEALEAARQQAPRLPRGSAVFKRTKVKGPNPLSVRKPKNESAGAKKKRPGPRLRRALKEAGDRGVDTFIDSEPVEEQHEGKNKRRRHKKGASNTEAK